MTVFAEAEQIEIKCREGGAGEEFAQGFFVRGGDFFGEEWMIIVAGMVQMTHFAADLLSDSFADDNNSEV